MSIFAVYIYDEPVYVIFCCKHVYIYIYIYINKTRLSPITQFFKHNFLFLYRFHCYTDHQEFNMALHRNDVSNVTFP